jgi:hypothetical protein
LKSILAAKVPFGRTVKYFLEINETSLVGKSQKVGNSRLFPGKFEIEAEPIE